MELGDLTTIVVIAVGAILAIPVLLAGVSIVVVVANRADPDPSGRRPMVVYLYAASFVALFLALFASYGVVRELCRLIASSTDGSSGDSGDSGDSGFFRPTSWVHQLGRVDDPVIKHPLGDSIARGAVGFGVVLLVAGVVLLLHLRAAGRISHGELATGGPVARVRQSYVAAVSFVCVVIVVITTAIAVYDVFGLVAPTVFDPAHPSNHAVVLRGLLPAAYLAVVSTVILLLHLRSVPPTQRPDFTGLPLLPFRHRTSVPALEGSIETAADPPVEVGEVLGSTATARPRPKPSGR